MSSSSEYDHIEVIEELPSRNSHKSGTHRYNGPSNGTDRRIKRSPWAIHFPPTPNEIRRNSSSLGSTLVFNLPPATYPRKVNEEWLLRKAYFRLQLSRETLDLNRESGDYELFQDIVGRPLTGRLLRLSDPTIPEDETPTTTICINPPTERDRETKSTDNGVAKR